MPFSCKCLIYNDVKEFGVPTKALELLARLWG
jgi:hypothetical protein